MKEGNSFSLCVSSYLDGGVQGGRGQGRVGTPPPLPIQVRSQDGGKGGYPLLPIQDRSQDGGAWVSPIQVRSLDRGGRDRASTPPPHPIQARSQEGGGEGVPPNQIRSDPRMEGTPYWNSIACACYVAGGMPLAFTQEDFLV